MSQGLVLTAPTGKSRSVHDSHPCACRSSPVKAPRGGASAPAAKIKGAADENKASGRKASAKKAKPAENGAKKKQPAKKKAKQGE